jgi:hypothetical protein
MFTNACTYNHLKSLIVYKESVCLCACVLKNINPVNITNKGPIGARHYLYCVLFTVWASLGSIEFVMFTGIKQTESGNHSGTPGKQLLYTHGSCSIDVGKQGLCKHYK